MIAQPPVMQRGASLLLQMRVRERLGRGKGGEMHPSSWVFWCWAGWGGLPALAACKISTLKVDWAQP